MTHSVEIYLRGIAAPLVLRFETRDAAKLGVDDLAAGAWPDSPTKCNVTDDAGCCVSFWAADIQMLRLVGKEEGAVPARALSPVDLAAQRRRQLARERIAADRAS